MFYHRIEHERGDAVVKNSDDLMKLTEVDEEDELERQASRIVDEAIQKAVTLETQKRLMS